jgi:predicted Rossmann-fold nucleotide-binding protein
VKEIDNKTDFKAWIKTAAPTLPNAAIQNLDLKEFAPLMIHKFYPNTLFLGCQLSDIVAGHIVQTGGTVIPSSKEVLFKSHLAHLYTQEELFKGFAPNDKAGYHKTLDYKIYEQYVEQGKDFPESIHVSLMRRLHDHSITEALKEAIAGQKVVAIMGGHGIERSAPFYQKIARIAWELTQKGFLLVSGGGPGIMEATHLGAYFATRSLEEMNDALKVLSVRPKGVVPGKEYDDWDWLHRAMKVIKKYPLTTNFMKAKSMSIGIPTWLYGHEPPAPFATHIAKYFANSVREDGLLAIAKHGVIFAPGSAGTTQEIFQDACQNHYAAYNKDPRAKRFVSPMILFGVEHWTKVRPVWNLMQTVTQNQRYQELLTLTDDAEETIEQIVRYNPADYQYPAQTL